jgi:hypothetical protein
VVVGFTCLKFKLHCGLFEPNWMISINSVGSNIEDVAREAGSIDLETGLLQGTKRLEVVFSYT